ncbi:DUF2087 domain-containing protein [Lactobacillus sp. ESL0791]|uniref:DUF2087 domain-containing protein n=1 Tax=Lactobacillus sp. ESL0791 TaxID=2983234 RepID=UPI0023F63C91|nr:DUF2087 domain-containing protein [Lactobacillus sp. ESL0791]MDF7639834.1 DUF2087 domain-containing protein [Lactobacillus sp. ESL0791]
MNETDKKTLERYLDEDGVVKTWPGKEKKRLLILQYLASKFEPGKKYSEPDVNLILRKYIDNYVTRRRDLIDHQLLNRTDDGKTYWVEKEK